MKSTTQLPTNYQPTISVDLEKNRKQFIIVNGISIAIGILMMACGIIWQGFTAFTELSLLDYGIILALSVIYTIGHEAVHGIAMKMCGTKKVKYGAVGVFAYAGSDDYYARNPYIFIALAPVVVYGILFAVLNFVLPVEYFWHVWLLQLINIAGAAGDFYVTIRFLFLPKDILVKDVGTSMQVYEKN